MRKWKNCNIKLIDIFITSVHLATPFALCVVSCQILYITCSGGDGVFLSAEVCLASGLIWFI